MNIIIYTSVDTCYSFWYNHKQKGEMRVVAKKLIKLLEKDGWVFASQKGSHMKYKKDNKVCIIPNHSGDIPKGTLAQIVRVTGIKF